MTILQTNVCGLGAVSEQSAGVWVPRTTPPGWEVGKAVEPRGKLETVARERAVAPGEPMTAPERFHFMDLLDTIPVSLCPAVRPSCPRFCSFHALLCPLMLALPRSICRLTCLSPWASPRNVSCLKAGIQHPFTQHLLRPDLSTVETAINNTDQALASLELTTF